MTILIVEHDMDFVMNLVDRLVVVDFGQKIAKGVPAENQENSKVQEAYLGCRMSPLLDVTDISVSLRVQPGAIVTVIGPNGAGKTTLLNALRRLLPCRGQIRLEGRDIAADSIEERVGAGLCLVAEKRELFGEMSVADNLLLGAYFRCRLRHTSREADLEAAHSRFTRLRERRDQLAGTLSGGERQMLAIARALMARPKLLMLDEPSLGLAPLIIREVFEIVQSLRDAGVAILIVEQNVRAALQIADFRYVWNPAPWPWRDRRRN